MNTMNNAPGHCRITDTGNERTGKRLGYYPRQAADMDEVIAYATICVHETESNVKRPITRREAFEVMPFPWETLDEWDRNAIRREYGGM